jgi:hypothetical protein
MPKRDDSLDTIEEFLQKARRRLSDENPDYYEQADAMRDGADIRPYDSGEDDEDRPKKKKKKKAQSAADWLANNDPTVKKPEKAEEKKEEAPPAKQEVAPAKQEEAKPAPAAQAAVPASANASPVGKKPLSDSEQALIDEYKRKFAKPVEPAPEKRRILMSQPSAAGPKDEMQPSREEVNAMREYTRPYEQHMMDKDKLEAEAHVNPQKHTHGRIIESRTKAHKDIQQAYQEMADSPEYQKADPITQMRMDTKFKQDWHANNPTHWEDAVAQHHEAYLKGAEASAMHGAAKNERIRHIAGGGVQPGAFSLEEGMQHAGGSRDDEDSAPSGIATDQAASFASSNRDFIDKFMRGYNKQDSSVDLNQQENFNNGRESVANILGSPPSLKDPSKKSKFDGFVSRYEPLIHKETQRVIDKMGLRQQVQNGQMDAESLLHYAGWHALVQAVNDYDFDHPSKASFTTHLKRKMQGLMQTALKEQDQIPTELRRGAKKFDKQTRDANAAPVKSLSAEEIERIKGQIAPPKGAVGDVKVSKPADIPSKTTSFALPAPAAPPPPSKPSSADIVAKHPPDVQDRLKRVAAARAPLVRRGVMPKPPTPAGPRRNVNIVQPTTEEEGGGEE